jgi:lysophospholipase L1-like esterase
MTGRAIFVSAVLAVFLVDMATLKVHAAEASRWEKEIQRFEELDRQNPPAAGGILFVGSSSIRLWDTARWFPDEKALNRGFGGSQIADVNAFAERIVLKYEPRVIVFYAGDNDVAARKTADQVFRDFKAFAERVESRLPQTHVIYVPIKPSPSRWKLWPSMQQANGLIRQYIEQHPNFHYADTATPMLGADGQPRPELFRADKLHLNDAGYEIWTGIVKTYLK